MFRYSQSGDQLGNSRDATSVAPAKRKALYVATSVGIESFLDPPEEKHTTRRGDHYHVTGRDAVLQMTTNARAVPKTISAFTPAIMMPR
jgi:hypothetical protein